MLPKHKLGFWYLGVDKLLKIIEKYMEDACSTNLIYQHLSINKVWVIIDLKLGI